MSVLSEAARSGAAVGALELRDEAVRGGGVGCRLCGCHVSQSNRAAGRACRERRAILSRRRTERNRPMIRRFDPGCRRMSRSSSLLAGCRSKARRRRGCSVIRDEPGDGRSRAAQGDDDRGEAAAHRRELPARGAGSVRARSCRGKAQGDNAWDYELVVAAPPAAVASLVPGGLHRPRLAGRRADRDAQGGPSRSRWSKNAAQTRVTITPEGSDKSRVSRGSRRGRAGAADAVDGPRA